LKNGHISIHFKIYLLWKYKQKKEKKNELKFQQLF